MMLIEMPITTDTVVRIVIRDLSTTGFPFPLDTPKTHRNRAEARRRKRPTSDMEMRAKVHR